MDTTAALAAALRARDAGRSAEAATLLRPLAEAGHMEAQVHLALLMLHGFHRFATTEEQNSWFMSASDAEQATFAQNIREDQRQAILWLENASERGLGPATHNLAMAYVAGMGDMPWDARRVKVKELLAKARAQGFTFFGSPDGDEGYLQLLEGYAAQNNISMPGEPKE